MLTYIKWAEHSICPSADTIGQGPWGPCLSLCCAQWPFGYAPAKVSSSMVLETFEKKRNILAFLELLVSGHHSRYFHSKCNRPPDLAQLTP